jgi:hypothetical protein
LRGEAGIKRFELATATVTEGEIVPEGGKFYRKTISTQISAKKLFFRLVFAKMVAAADTERSSFQSAELSN